MIITFFPESTRNLVLWQTAVTALYLYTDHLFSKKRGGGAGSLVVEVNDQGNFPDLKAQEGTCAMHLLHVWEEALTASTSLLLAQLAAQQLGLLLGSTGTPLSPLYLTLGLTCRAANPLAWCPTELIKETRWGVAGGIRIRIRNLLMRGLHMSQHLQSTKQGQICECTSDQTPTEPKASQNHTCSPVKSCSPESPFIATHIYIAVIRLSRETTWCWWHKEHFLMLQHIRLMRKAMWLQTAMLLTAQLHSMICLLPVAFGRGWEVEKQRSSVTKIQR